MTLDLAEAAAHDADLQASFCVSRQSDTFAPLAALGVPMFALDTFASYAGAVGNLAMFESGGIRGTPHAAAPLTWR